jgi:L-alanine-DL-glutamate epimerase-like enolase superfamily enzyme
MNISRRSFLATAAAGSAASFISPVHAAEAGEAANAALERELRRPVLKKELFTSPVRIESMRLLKNGRNYLLHVRSTDGAEGLSVDNGRADVLLPLLRKSIIPYFIGKDARDLEEHLWGVYRHNDNYKMQGLIYWSAIALVEFAILDLLGRVAKKPIGALLGEVKRDQIPFYIASGRRDTTPQEEVDYLRKLIDETGALSVKYRIGGRMNRDVDALPGRTETLIPLSRKALGDKTAIHADSNSSYSPAKAIEVGRMLEDINAVFYEEPCEFDDFEGTKKVTDALKIPIALGEQEYSEWRFLSAIKNRVADIMQPDLFYYGGLIRSIRVARMAQLKGMPTTCHISGGFGFVYMLHFASIVADPGPWQEYKEGVKTFGSWFEPAITIKNGAISVPKTPGVGIANVAELVKGAEVIAS